MTHHSILDRLSRLVFRRGLRRRSPSRRTLSLPADRASLALEPRLALSTSALMAPVTMLSASTADSQSVTIRYRVDSTAEPLQFGIYRSADAHFDAGDSLVSTWTATAPSLDDSGQQAAGPGTHQLTIPLSDGLPPYPRKPYVLVVADPSLPSAATDSAQAAAFRKYVIGIVTHGALISSSWKHGPPWQLQTATILKQQGYDAVIPYAWVSDSSNPGHAAIQGPRLARAILKTAAGFPAGAPIDIHLIGHSEGAVVNTQAIIALESSMTPEIRAGYLEDTLLDPHAASNSVPGQASAAGGLWGAFATAMVSNFQSRADDPAVFIPASVDRAEVFYQHTPIGHARGLNMGLYNLWGQVPVPNLSNYPVVYENLTAAGAVHSGNYGVALWYRNFVAPTLGDQAPRIRALRIQGQVDGATISTQSVFPRGVLAGRRVRAWGTVAEASESRVAFSGTAPPRSTVRVFAGPAVDPSRIAQVARVKADSEGDWSIATPPLKNGQYRAIAMAFTRTRGSRMRPALNIVPMTPLGRFAVRSS